MSQTESGKRVLPADVQFMQPNDAEKPNDIGLRSIKFLMRVKIYSRLFFKGLYSPLTNAGAFFALLTIPAFYFFIILFGGKKGFADAVNSLGANIFAIIAILPIWALIIAVVSIYRTVSEERKLGGWRDQRFIFVEPQLVMTTEVKPTDDENSFWPFSVPHSVPGLLVEYRIEVEGPSNRVNCIVLGAYYLRPVRSLLRDNQIARQGRAVVKHDGTLGLHCFSLPDTVPAIVRVYALAYERDPTVLMDFTDVSTQTRVVLAPPSPA